LSSSRWSHSHASSAAGRQRRKAELHSLGAERLQLGKVAVGVARSEDRRPIFAKGLIAGSLPGFRRATTFQARRQDFMAWLTLVRRSRATVLPSASVSVTTSSQLGR